MLDLPAGILRQLETVGVYRFDDLMACTRAELLNVPGIGRNALATIEAALKARGLRLRRGAARDSFMDPINARRRAALLTGAIPAAKAPAERTPNEPRK